MPNQNQNLSSMTVTVMVKMAGMRTVIVTPVSKVVFPERTVLLIKIPGPNIVFIKRKKLMLCKNYNTTLLHNNDEGKNI